MMSPLSIASWCWYDGDILTIEQAAMLADREPWLLRDWLADHAPPQGGRLAGKPIRIASQDEILRVLNTPEIEAPSGCSWEFVLWTHPNGREEVLTLKVAAARFRDAEGNSTLKPKNLWRWLRYNPRIVDGHRLRLTARRPDSIRSKLRVQGLPRPVLWGDRLFETTVAAANALGMTAKTLRKYLAKGGLIVDGKPVRFQGEAMNSATATDARARGIHPDDAARNQELEVQPDEKRTYLISEVETVPATVKRRRAGKGINNGIISENTLRLLSEYADRQGLTTDAALLQLLPQSPSLAAVLSAVDTSVLAGLSEVDWQQLRAIAAA